MSSTPQYSHACNNDVFLEARALVAVGLDGTMVVLSAAAENRYLVDDARSGRLNICLSQMPTEPGLYEFRGYTAMEHDAHCNLQIVHRGECHKVAC